MSNGELTPPGDSLGPSASVSPIAEIPVSMIGAWGKPVVVGKAIFEDTQNVRIQFDDHQLVSEFYDLSEQELVLSVSFQYNTRQRQEQPPEERPAPIWD